MAKTKNLNKQIMPAHLPIAPWIYVHYPVGYEKYPAELASLIPKCEEIELQVSHSSTSSVFDDLKESSHHDKVLVLTSAPTLTTSARLSHARSFKAAAIAHGCNFVGVEIVPGDSTTKDDVPKETWGSNHLRLSVGGTTDNASVKLHAEQIYKWLFTKLSVLETLHLIPDEQMTSTKASGFDDYAYCPLGESRLRPKDAKIQFVALVLAKPQVGPNNRVAWRVADKSGIANFYFTHRGPSSQYTWDWVLALQPGDRKCLPRMPSVLIKERPFKTIVKAPFRATGAAFNLTGTCVKGIGKGLSKVGHKVKLGNRSEWVPQDDVGIDAKGRQYKKPGYAVSSRTETRRSITVFDEKGNKAWKDDDSIASTTAGSIINEKSFV